MSIKMVLVPADQYLQQQQQHPPQPKRNLEPDVELKLRRHHEPVYDSSQHLAPAADVLNFPPGKLNVPIIGEKLDLLLQHLKHNRERVKADKRTGEFFFDGKLVPGSDIRRLFGDVVSRKEKSLKPSGWGELRDVLQYTHAPEEILGQDWEKVNQRADEDRKEQERVAFEKTRP